MSRCVIARRPRFVFASLILAAAPAAQAGSTIIVTTAADTIDFAWTGSGPATLVRPAWDMTPQTDNGSQPSPGSGVWVPASGAPTVAQLAADLAARGDGKVSLREAIVIANATQYAGSESGPTTIQFDTVAMGGNTVTLDTVDNGWYGPNALPPVYARVVIDGGAGVTLQRQYPATTTAAAFRLFYVAGRFHNLVDGKASASPTPGALTLRHLTLRQGLALGGGSGVGGGGAGLGGAVFNQGTLVLDATVIEANRALGGSSGQMTLGGGGGGIGGDAIGDSGGGFRPGSLSGDGGGFLSHAPGAEGGASAANGGQGGISRYGGNGATAVNATPCALFGNGGGFRSDASATQRGDGGGYSAGCRGGGGAFGGGGGYTSGAGGVGGGGAAGAGGGFGAGGGTGGLGGFGGGSGRGRGVWGFGGGAGGPNTASTPGGGGAGLGGGVFNHTGSLRLINGARIDGNTAEGGAGYVGGSGFGGGIFNLDGDVRIDASSLNANRVAAGTVLGSGMPAAAGGAIYSRFQDEDAGIDDLGAVTPSTSAVTLANGAALTGSVGAADCYADAGERQGSGSEEARLPYFHFDGAYTLGSDASGLHACTAQDRPGVYFVFAYHDNTAGAFAARGWLDAASPFQQNLRAAAALWSREFAPATRLRLTVLVDATNSAAGFSANAYYGRTVGSFNGPNGANAVREPAALQKWRTGASTAGVYDMLLEPNPAFVDQYYWLDPTPDNRNDNAIPAGRNDLVSVVLHELGHGFGFTSWRTREPNSPAYGAYIGQVTLFDSLALLTDPAQAGSQSLFAGPSAMAAYGGQVLPLTLWGAASPNYGSDFAHFGTTCNHRDNDASVDPRLRYALMTTCPLPTSGYVSITMPDRAVLKDLGYPIDTIFKTGFAHD